MVPLTMLWLPILVSAVIVFIAATISWMVLPHHRTDYRKLPDEDAVIEALREGKQGQYSFPHAADRKSMNEEWKAKMQRGPAGFVVLMRRGPMSMAPNLVQYFIWILVIEVFVAYVSGRALPSLASYLDVFQIAGTVAILGFAGAIIPSAIWFGRPWSVVVKDVVDGIVYGLLTAGVFGWLWPRGIDI